MNKAKLEAYVKYTQTHKVNCEKTQLQNVNSEATN